MNYAKFQHPLIETAVRHIWHPWIKRIIKRLPIVDGSAVTKTMATDGARIFVNPHYITTLSIGELAAVLVHEALHVIMRHPLRRNGRDPRKWNVACDHAINWIIDKLNYTLPKNVLEGREGSAEQIYGQVEREYEQEQQSRQQNNGESSKSEQSDDNAQSNGSNESKDSEQQDGGDSESGEQGEQGESGESGQSGEAAESGESSSESTAGNSGDPGNAYDDDGVDLFDYPLEDGETMADAERRIDRLCAGASMDMEHDDEEPSHYEKELLIDRAETELDWPKELEEYIQNLGGAEYSMNPPHIGFMQQGIICNQLNPSGIGNVVLAVDVSGSIDKPKLKLVITHLMLFIENIDYESLRIITCDTSVRFDETYFRGVPVDWNDLVRRGITGGGTKVKPVFDKLNDEGVTPDLLIYFTDLLMPRKGISMRERAIQEDDPGYPVVWLVDQEGACDGTGGLNDPEESTDNMWKTYGWEPEYGIAIDACK